MIAGSPGMTTAIQRNTANASVMWTLMNYYRMRELMTDDLHHSVSRMAAGLILFNEADTKGDIRQTADWFATQVIELIHADLREKIIPLLRTSGLKHMPPHAFPDIERGYDMGLDSVLDLLGWGYGDE